MRHSPLLFFGALLILLLFSLTTIWSTANNLFLPQLTFIVLGALLAFIAYKTDMHLLFSFAWPLYIFTILLLITTLVLGEVTRGSTRWIELGFFRLQGSEMAKPILALFLADYLGNRPPTKFKNIFTYLCLLALPVALVLVQPDLGSAMVITAMGLGLLLIAGIPWRYVLVGLVMFALIAPPLYEHLQPYQKLRIQSFINPYADPDGSGYNVIQSVIAVGSGNFFGMGVKQGTQSHLKFLPERHTDFAYASFAEEFGFIGSALLFSAYLTIFFFWLRLAQSVSENRETYLIIAALTVFAFQAIVNLGMNLGIMPVTGITLPLVSYGGSSVLSLFSFIGMTQNLNRRRAFSGHH